MTDGDTLTPGSAKPTNPNLPFQPPLPSPRPKVTTRPSGPPYPAKLGKVQAAMNDLPELMIPLMEYPKKGDFYGVVAPLENSVDYPVLLESLVGKGHDKKVAEWAIHEHVEGGHLQAVAGINDNIRRQRPSRRDPELCDDPELCVHLRFDHRRSYVSTKEYCRLVWLDAMTAWWENGCCEHTAEKSDLSNGHGDKGPESQSKTPHPGEPLVVVPTGGKPDEQKQVSGADATPKEEIPTATQALALDQYSRAVRDYDEKRLGYPTYAEAHAWCLGEGMELSDLSAWQKSISRARKSSGLPSLKTRPNNKPRSAVLASELSNKSE